MRSHDLSTEGSPTLIQDDITVTQQKY